MGSVGRGRRRTDEGKSNDDAMIFVLTFLYWRGLLEKKRVMKRGLPERRKRREGGRKLFRGRTDEGFSPNYRCLLTWGKETRPKRRDKRGDSRRKGRKSLALSAWSGGENLRQAYQRPFSHDKAFQVEGRTKL